MIALTIFGTFMCKTAEMLVLQSLKFRGQKVIEFDLLLSVLRPGISLGILSQTLSAGLSLLRWETKFHTHNKATGKVTILHVLLFMPFRYYVIRQELLN